MSFVGRIILEKMDFEKSPKNGQISPKSTGVNLNFLTILDHFWDFLKRLKKASSGRKKRFYFGFSFIERIIVDKMYFEKRPPQKSKGVNLNFLTILDHYITNLVQKNKINFKKKIKVTFVTGSIFSMWERNTDQRGRDNPAPKPC